MLYLLLPLLLRPDLSCQCHVFGESSSTSSMTLISKIYYHTYMRTIIICDFIDGSSAFSHSLTFDNCMTTLLCTYLLNEGQCFIHYGQDQNFSSLSSQGPLNSPFTLPPMDENTFYYYLLNNTFGIQFTGNFTTGECELV